MRPYTHLAQNQRYQIDALLKQKTSQTRIADILGVHKSTISRELSRNRVFCSPAKNVVPNKDGCFMYSRRRAQGKSAQV